MEETEDEFNQGIILPPLIVQLRKILEQYPDDTQILKELIQNAEDAGAREVKFMYDRHTYGKDTRYLQHPGLASYQGPALYAYNDGLFDEEDWKGIRMLSQSVKQADPNKVGYFGMGFKSVFHLTDLPFILSGDRMGVIDPHQNHFKQTTFAWNYGKKPEVLSTRRHQFEPFINLFDCTEAALKKGQYRGTIFRFPLRSKESPLSEKIYTQERIDGLFDCFEEDSNLLLLFLKNIEKVQLYERDPYQIKPKLLFEVKITDDCLEFVREKRQAFIKTTKSGTWLDQPVVSTYPLTIETCKPTKTGTQKHRFHYLITNYYCGGNVSASFKRLCQDQELHNAPWVGVAMPLSQSTDAPKAPGHVFCFLPLPKEEKSMTGLPVHLNAFFALEHNRKYVKWPAMYRTTIRDDLMDKRLLWNQSLLREALPKAYANLILSAIQRHSDEKNPLPLETIYAAFPDFSSVDRKWEPLLLPFYADVFNHPVIYTEVGDVRWVEAKKAVLDTCHRDNKAREVILQVLSQAGICVASVPHHVVDAVRRCYRYGFNQITPALVSTKFKEIQHDLSLHWDAKMELLRYFLADHKYDLLDGLELLPLANGGFHTFFYNSRRADRPIYIATKSHPASLLPGLEDDFIDPELDGATMEMLIRGARRGYTQLKLLDDDAIMSHLPRCLPAAWFTSAQVTWDPAAFQHPPASWMKELWEYLTKQYPVNLSAFEKLPIIPVRVYDNGAKTDLVPLAHNTSLICREFDGVSLEEALVQILNQLGVTVIEELPSYIKAHPLVTRKYTFTPTHIGVLKSVIALTNIHGLPQVIGKLEALTPEEKRQLRLLFSKIYPHELKPDFREVLKHMPLFESMKHDKQESSFVSCIQVNLAGPKSLPPIPISQKLLDVTGTDSQNLATLLDVTQLTEVELLTSIVFPDIESAFYELDAVSGIMQYVLRHFHAFQETCPHFKETLRNLAFIPRKDTLVTPDRFYDPDHELLEKVFLKEDENFPHGLYSDSALIAVLREIGLRGPQDVQVEDLLESVHVIQDMVDGGKQDVTTIGTKSDAILEYLMKFPDVLDRSLDEKSLCEHLKGVKWVRVQTARPALYPHGLKWYPDDSKGPCFHCPTGMRSREFADLIGATQPVVAVRSSNPVALSFGWDLAPDIDSVMEQYSHLIGAYTGAEKAKFSEIISQIFAVFTQSSPDVFLRCLERHHMTKWVWHGDGFCAVNQTVFQEPFMDLSPFMFSIPSGLDHMHGFLEECGVRKDCNLTEVLRLVQKKYEISREFTEAEVKRDLHVCVSTLNELKTNLTDESLEQIKQELVVPVHTGKQSSPTLKLVAVSKCSYCDEEWLRQGRDLSDLTDIGSDGGTDEDPLLVHPNVPSSTSEALGVPTLMSRMLEAEELDFSFGQSDSLTHRLHTLLQDYTDGFAVPKELVQNADDAGATEVCFLYDERTNDDAMTCLIDEGMRECQGPALWSYNDACFSDEDFENICKLSGATKETQTDKIGRFGLGFNAVYNLTDVPSFVSRHNIVIFDPHTTYLGRSIKNKSKPGIKIDMRKHRRKLRRIGNQFKPYNDIFRCDLRPEATSDIYEGTLFRFPLRTKAQALRSEICQKHYANAKIRTLLQILITKFNILLLKFPLRTKAQALRSEICGKHYDDAEMRTLLQMLITSAEALLLFTQNVCKIAVYHLPPHSTGTPRLIEMFKGDKKPVCIVRELLPKVECPPTANKLSDDMKEMIQQSSVLKSATDVMKKIKLGVPLRRLECPSSSQIVELDCSTRDGAVSKLQLPRGVVVRQWLISSYMGTGDSLHMAEKAGNLIPCVGVAVPVSRDPEHDSAFTPHPILGAAYPRAPAGAVFSYMPLPVGTGLPVHVNGAFAISSSRRHLCERNEDDKYDVRAVWNETLLLDGVSHAYVHLLHDLSSIAPPTEFGYAGVWPNITQAESNVREMALQVFRLVVESQGAARPISSPTDREPLKRMSTHSVSSLTDRRPPAPIHRGLAKSSSVEEAPGRRGGQAPATASASESDSKFRVFSDGVTWREFQSVRFLSCELESSSTAHSTTALRVARQAGKDDSHVILYLPEFIRRGFVSAGHENDVTNHTYTIEAFYKEVFLPNINSVDHIDRDSLILQALSLNNDYILTLLKTSSCIPVTPKGDVLKCPRELIDPASDIAVLFSPEDQTFPYGVFQERNTLDVLRRLGLRSERISWGDTVRCARALDGVGFTQACKRIPTLLRQIERNIQACESDKDIKQYLLLLQDIKFLIPLKQPDYFPFSWKSTQLGEQVLLSPKRLYHPVHKDTLCLVEPILDLTTVPNECVSTIDCLAMSTKDPHIESVLQQLEILADTDNESCLTDNRIFKDVHRICMAVYELLQYRCESEEVKQKVIERLQNRPFLLCHGKFLLPSQLAFEFQQNCAPYLYSVPDTLRKNYEKFLRMMGVRDCFEASDYVIVLQDMHTKYGDQPLKKDALKVALQIVNLLNEVMSDLNQSLHDITDQYGTIYIPDANGVLRPSLDLCFNEPDVNWVPSAEFTSYSHPHIPFTISKQLGVSTKRQDMLSKHSRGIPFGQKERLTNRIRRILSSYPCDKEILKELLQNADDAGATEIHFVNDPRTHRAERVFDESWKPLQGPALCVFNDKPFTEEDIDGIQRLGEGSKSSDPNKTGQYGVGFNCVYHLTDAPSFLTSGAGGETLCVFDPHGKYVPGATSEQPGRRYDDVGNLRKIFTDVFPCYLEDKHPVSQGGGTMFRFPLRTPDMAAESELSNKCITSEDITNLFAKFRTEMFDCLLFVNHIKSIMLSEVDPRSGKLMHSYTVCVELSEEDQKARDEFSQFLEHITAKIQRGDMQIWTIPSKEVSYTLNIADSNGYHEKWLVHQSIGFEEGTEISGTLIDAFKRKDLSLLPRGGVAALLERGKGTSLEPRHSKAFCFLPLPIRTALPVNINGHFALDHEARRNLWSDEDKGPKSEWNYLLLNHVIAPAYVSILKQVPSHISVNSPSQNLSFMDVVDQNVPAMETYSALFPRFTSSEPYWRCLTKGVYSHIHSCQAPVLPIVRTTGLPLNLSDTFTGGRLDESGQAEVEWMTTTGVGSVKPYFNTLEDDMVVDELSVSSLSARRRLTSTPKRKPKTDRLKEAFIECGVKLVHLPIDICRCFMDSDVPVESLSPETIVDFFVDYKVAGTTCTLRSTPLDLDDSPIRSEDTFNLLLEYCMLNRDYFLASLDGLPLLLTDDNQIREFSKTDPVYLTAYSDLLSDCGSQFVHRAVARSAFRDVNVDDCEVMERFDIHAFAGLLPNVLSEPWYKKENEHALWIQEADQLPTPVWIGQVWSFLRAEYERILTNQKEVTSHEELVQGILRPLEEWCLLPASVAENRVTSTPKRASRSFSLSAQEASDTQLYLVPLGLAHTVLDFTHTSVMNYAFRGAVRNLCLPELTAAMIDGGQVGLSPHPSGKSSASSASHLARIVVGSMEKPRTVLQALAFAFETGNLSHTIRPDDCSLILKYLNDCGESWRDLKECILMLRDLPMFLSVHGDLVAIRGNTAYVLPPDIPQVDLEIWEQDAQVVFLRKNTALEALYDIIGCISLSATQMYSQFTFQNFGKLSPEGRIRHLEFIRDIKLPQLTGDEKATFTQNLENLRFLEHDGRFKSASEFFDPYNPVFKAMFAQEKSVFPPPPFCEFKWLDFMKAVGLQHEVTCDQYVSFAERVANEVSATGPTEATFNAARTLVTHLFQRSDVAREGILESIKDIAFIPAAKVNTMLSKMYPTLAQHTNTPYITFAQGIPECHEALVWTSRHLLPNWANPFKLNSSEVSWNYDVGRSELCDFSGYKKRITDLLGLQEEPSVKDVVDNAKNICSSLYTKQTDAHDELRAFMKVDVMKMIYKFLAPKAQSDPTTQEELQSTNCVLVDLGYTFVRPAQVVIELYEEDQIAPYLYKLPTELGEFKNLFLHLGATEHATPVQYAMVLENMYKKTFGAKLHPNELKTAFKAVYEIFTALQRHPVDDLEIDVLFLPSASGKLLSSNELVFNNNQSYSERISNFSKPFLVDLSECKLTSKTGTFEDTVRLLPRRLRPPKLTVVVSEKLEQISRDSVLTHGICDKIRHQLNSRAFAMGILRLIKHEHHRAGHRVKKEVLDRIQTKLKKVKVYGVETLITYLSYGGDRMAESESQCECFAEKVHDDNDEEGLEVWSLYIDNSLSMNEELLVGVAEFVNMLAGGLVRHSVHYLQPILACSPHSIYRILDRLKIRPDHSIDFKQPTLPTPGLFIPIEDHHLLNEDFDNFEAGEYVGYELSDDESGGQTFIYALIVEKIQLQAEDESKLHFRQKYRINVGDDRKLVEALQTDLYKFHRVEGLVSRDQSMSESFLVGASERLNSPDPHSPYGSYRDSYSSRTSESVYEPQTPRRKRADTTGGDDVFTTGKFSDIKEERTPKSRGRKTPKKSSDTSYTNGDHPDGADQEGEETTENGENEEGVQDEPEYTSYYERYLKGGDKKGKKTDPSHDQTEGETAEEGQEAEGSGEEARPELTPEEEAAQRQANAENMIPEPSDETKSAEQFLVDVSDALEEAWKLDKSQRKKVIKRLLLKWHPDKNLDNERMSTMVTQHIQSEIERLEQGLPRPDKFDDILNQFNFDPRNPFSKSTTFQKNFYSAYQYFFDQVNQRAKEHKQQRERYKEYFSKEYSSSRTGDYNFEVPPTFTSSNPQPNQAKRFLKQAQEDLRAADNDYDVREPSYEWVCFKAHQAAEKALKAAQFSVDAVTSFNHDLSVLAASIEDLELRRLAMKLQQIIGDQNKLYNPDPIDFVIIPHEEFTREMACDAVMCATDILERVKEFVELRE